MNTLKVGQEIWVKGVVEEIDGRSGQTRINFKEAYDYGYFPKDFDYRLEPPKTVSNDELRKRLRSIVGKELIGGDITIEFSDKGIKHRDAIVNEILALFPAPVETKLEAIDGILSVCCNAPVRGNCWFHCTKCGKLCNGKVNIVKQEPKEVCTCKLPTVDSEHPERVGYCGTCDLPFKPIKPQRAEIAPLSLERRDYLAAICDKINELVSEHNKELTK